MENKTKHQLKTFKTRNKKTRVSLFPAPGQHSDWNLSYTVRQKKEVQRKTEEVALIPDNMILHIRNSENHHQKTLRADKSFQQKAGDRIEP